MVVLGGWLDFMILKVFANLWFYDSILLADLVKCFQSHLCSSNEEANSSCEKSVGTMSQK